MKKLLLSSLAAAGMIATGAVHAAATSDAPLQAGEASTMTQGRPNLETTNSPYPDGTAVVRSQPVVVSGAVLPTWHPPVAVVSRSAIDPDHWHGDATPTSNVPTRAGEASTMTNGQPNMITNNWQSPQLNLMVVRQQGQSVADNAYGYTWQR